METNLSKTTKTQQNLIDGFNTRFIYNAWHAVEKLPKKIMDKMNELYKPHSKSPRFLITSQAQGLLGVDNIWYNKEDKEIHNFVEKYLKPFQATSVILGAGTTEETEVKF